MTTASLSYR